MTEPYASHDASEIEPVWQTVCRPWCHRAQLPLAAYLYVASPNYDHASRARHGV
jgi:hypothetical protein